METYIKWITSKTDPAENGGGQNKSKIVSYLISTGFALQFVIDKAIPESMKDIQFYIFKIFFNNLVFFILVPVAIIYFLETVNNYCRQFISSVYTYLKELKLIPYDLSKVEKAFSLLRVRKIHPKSLALDLEMYL